MPIPRLLEREDSLALLNLAFANAQNGAGQCVFVLGEAGIGKTSLVRNFMRQHDAQSLQLTGACDALFTPRPLAPVYDLVAQLNEDWAPDVHSIASRAELFDRLLYALSHQPKTVILFFEDIHWADEASLDFVKFIVRRMAAVRCLFIMTYRDDEIKSDDPLHALAGDLPRDLIHRISLKPLSLDSVRKMGRRVEIGDVDSGQVYQVTAGNPFYVNELLENYSPGIPANIKDSILSVYKRQSPDTRELWQLLSVIPEGTDLGELFRFDPSLHAAIDDSLSRNILVSRNGKVFFKHELYRRTIEDSLSVMKRSELNKRVIETFLPSFQVARQYARIVHYARNAGNKALVLEYAPMAAQQAIDVAAHLQASGLYLAAIEAKVAMRAASSAEAAGAIHSGGGINVALYIAYAYECYLTNQIAEAIKYEELVLPIFRAANDIEQVGDHLRFLSRLWWYHGNREHAERYGWEAIRMLEPLPMSRAKAMAASNMSQLKMLSGETGLSVEWGTRAIDMARQLQDYEVLSHALNNVGTAQWNAGISEELAEKQLQESLQLALQHDYQEHAARAFTNLVNNYLVSKNYEQAKTILAEGIAYCERYDLDTWLRYKLNLKASLLLEVGEWDQAIIVSQKILDTRKQPAMNKIGALVTAGTVAMRRGDEGALNWLLEAKSLAIVTDEHQRVIPVLRALLEYEWLTGEHVLNDEEIANGIKMVQRINEIGKNSAFVYWLAKNRPDTVLPDIQLFDAYQWMMNGDVVRSAERWSAIGCPYEVALSYAGGDGTQIKQAMTILQDMCAARTIAKLKGDLRTEGAQVIPRGSRISTRKNPGQLTNRELEILLLLKEGSSNKEIAQKLFVSPKTVDHHISSILFKIDAPSRGKAVSEALRLGIIK